MSEGITITGMRIEDLRFPTSESLDGSDAMNLAPDYSAAYVILETSQPGLEGHGLTFTIGRGNEICCAAIEALRPLIVGLSLDWITEDMARFWRHVTSDSQLRWIGPDKGAMHLATGAVVNAVWDMWAKAEGKPVWRLVADMTPEELIRCIDFRYLTDAITPEEALALLQERQAGKADRIAKLERDGYPCYTTSAGWLGYSDEKLRRLCREAVESGFCHIKLKVGRDLQEDIRRVRIAREEIGDECNLMIDANQIWDVDEAVRWVGELAFAKPWFIEEPTSPDDVAGHRAIREAIAPIKVATGEMCQNRVLFKQFIAGGAIDVVQIDACRVGGVNEVLAILLLAAKYDLPVCPHAGGVGLCEYVQHLAMIDYLCIAGTHDGRVVEYIDHLHQHFVDPCIVRNAAYMAPTAPGFSITMKPESRTQYRFQPAIAATVNSLQKANGKSAPGRAPRIDSHQHFWRYDPHSYPWISDDMDVLKRDRLAGELKPLLDAVDMDGVIAVQARADEAENDFLLQLADGRDWIAAIVGWIDLAAEDAGDRIAYWKQKGRFAGVRHLLQDVPDLSATLDCAGFNGGMRQAQDHALVYDLLVRGAGQLTRTLEFCARHDRHWLVLDHLGKPDIGGEDDERWATALHELAAMPHVLCKISGLPTETRNWPCDIATLHRYLDTALEAFGPQRLMFGSDWPVCLLRSEYAEVATVTSQWAERALSPDERDGFWGGNAARCYTLAMQDTARNGTWT